MYKIIFTKTAQKLIRKTPQLIVKRIIAKAESLADNPRPEGSKKLKGKEGELWRVRVGDYRIVYLIEEEIKIIKVTKIGHRKDIYRD